MINWTTIARLLLCLGSACLLCARHAAAADQTTLVAFYEVNGADSRILQPVARTSGVVLWRGEQKFTPGLGEPIRDGDVLETSPSAASQIAYAPGHRVLVMPGTRVRLGRLFLFIGELLVRARGIFHIETSFMTAGVEGTEFLMRAEGAGDKVDVIVTEGAVLCRSLSGLWSPVRVAEAEHLRAQAAHSAPDEGASDGAIVLFRGEGNSKVQKAPARGFELSRIQVLGREMGAGKGR